MSEIRVCYQDDVAYLFLSRPEQRNAFTALMIDEVTTIARDLAKNATVRIVVLGGEGSHFCAGADLAWMQASIALSHEQNIADAERMGAMFEALDQLPQPLIARIQGAALGGGSGLVAVCDIALATDEAFFGFPEVRLGLIPAMIAPYVMTKIGYSQTRLRFITGSRFDATIARQIGLIHDIVPEAEIDAKIQEYCHELRQAAPGAITAAKSLLANLQSTSLTPGTEHKRRKRTHNTAEILAARRCTTEAQAGLQARLARRAAPWVTPC